MKKFLSILGGIFLVLLIVGASLFGFVAYKGNNLDKECTAFVDDVVPKIIAHWDVPEFYSYADKEALKTSNVTPEQIEKLFTWFKTLGPLEHYDGSKGNAEMGYFNGKESITGRYMAKATFKAGEAYIEVDLTKKSREWKIVGLNVRSNALLPNNGR